MAVWFRGLSDISRCLSRSSQFVSTQRAFSFIRLKNTFSSSTPSIRKHGIASERRDAGSPDGVFHVFIRALPAGASRAEWVSVSYLFGERPPDVERKTGARAVFSRDIIRDGFFVEYSLVSSLCLFIASVVDLDGMASIKAIDHDLVFCRAAHHANRPSSSYLRPVDSFLGTSVHFAPALRANSSVYCR